MTYNNYHEKYQAMYAHVALLRYIVVIIIFYSSLNIIFLFLQLFLNYLGNYIPNQWIKTSGCVHCLDDTTKLSEDQGAWPKVFLSIFVENPTPFMDHFLEKIEKLDYPKELLTIWIHNQVSTKL